MADVKKLIDITRLGEYDVLLKQYIGEKETAIYNKIGTVPATVGEGEDAHSVSNLVDYIQKSIALVNGDASALEERVEANEEAIGAANTAAEGEASNATGLYAYVDTAAAAAIAKIVAGAGTSYDTLKEIEDWINNNTTGAAKMQSDIKVLQGTDGSTQTKESASIPGVKLYIDDLVSNKNATAEGESGDSALVSASADSNKVTVASTAKLQAAVVRAEGAVLSVSEGTSVENYVTLTVTDADAAKVAIDDSALAAKIGAAKTANDAATGMYADIQGQTNQTIAGLDSKVGAIVAVGAESPSTVIDYIDKKSAANVSALQGSTTETVASVEAKVDNLQVAEASDITALFSAE